MRSMFDMGLLERLRFLTMKAEQAVKRTEDIKEFRQFLVSPEAMDLFDATTLRIQVVGEMLKQIDDMTGGRILCPCYPEIPWRSVFDMRNFISHEYCMVDPEEIFNVVKEDLPYLIETLHRIIADFEAGIHSEIPPRQYTSLLKRASLAHAGKALFFFNFETIKFYLLSFKCVSYQNAIPTRRPKLLKPSTLYVKRSPLFVP